jgi:GT2 family glycosyltransferase
MCKATVIIPSYNNKKLLEQCVESIVANDWDLIDRLIIVDNNSDDFTKNYLKEFNDPKIEIIYNDVNLGFAKTLI